MTIRDVRPNDDFYRGVDEALVLASAWLSRVDFDLYVLPGILARFAKDWDDCRCRLVVAGTIER